MSKAKRIAVTKGLKLLEAVDAPDMGKATDDACYAWHDWIDANGADLLLAYHNAITRLKAFERSPDEKQETIWKLEEAVNEAEERANERGLEIHLLKAEIARLRKNEPSKE